MAVVETHLIIPGTLHSVVIGTMSLPALRKICLRCSVTSHSYLVRDHPSSVIPQPHGDVQLLPILRGHHQVPDVDHVSLLHICQEEAGLCLGWNHHPVSLLE